jgi:hypothetical protein
MFKWCFNELIVEGDETKIQEFKELVKDRDMDLSLDKLVPMPPELFDVKPENSEPNWIDWRLDNWGTKWDVKAELVDETEDSLKYFLLSADAAPIEWLKAVSLKMPFLQFELFYHIFQAEPSNGVVDIVKAKGGDISEVGGYV